MKKMQGEKGGIFESSLRAVGLRRQVLGRTLRDQPVADPRPHGSCSRRPGLEYPRTWGRLRRNLQEGAEAARSTASAWISGSRRTRPTNIMQVCWCFGGYTVDDAGKVAFDNPGNVRGLPVHLRHVLEAQDHPPRRGRQQQHGSWNNKAYQSGQVAFINNPTSVYAYLSGKDPELMKKTGLFSVPAGPAGAINQIDTWSLGLFKPGRPSPSSPRASPRTS